MRRYLLILPLLSLTLCAQTNPAESRDDRPCVVIAQTGNWFKGDTYQYLAGEFPRGVKFRAELRNRHLREIYGKGGRVVIMPRYYGYKELTDAQNSCKVTVAEAK